MSTRNSIPPCTSRFYRITVEGKIDPSWSEWLAGMELVTRKETDGISVTTLSGILIDQAALRGLLNRLWDLNLILRSIDQIHPAQISNK
jgi:hypothetical protein